MAGGGIEGREIRLSEPLLTQLAERTPYAEQELMNTLAHEMIHQWQFDVLKRRPNHGPDFLRKMTEMNRSGLVSITTYHSLQKEVLALARLVGPVCPRPDRGRGAGVPRRLDARLPARGDDALPPVLASRDGCAVPRRCAARLAHLRAPGPSRRILGAVPQHGHGLRLVPLARRARRPRPSSTDTRPSRTPSRSSSTPTSSRASR